MENDFKVGDFFTIDKKDILWVQDVKYCNQYNSHIVKPNTIGVILEIWDHLSDYKVLIDNKIGFMKPKYLRKVNEK